MHAALTRLMTGQRPADGGDTSIDRRNGYVTFPTLLEALKQAMEPHTAALDRLERAFSRELRMQTEALGERLERHEDEAEEREARIAALEAWRRDEEIDEAFRRGFWHVVVLGFRYLTEHWPAMLAMGATIVGIVWVVISGGQPGIEVRP